MKMLSTRRGFLASLGLAAAVRGAGMQKIRAGCLSVADTFDNLVLVLREMQGLGYSGFATTLRLLQSQSGQIDEARAQLGPIGLDLIGVRVALPKYGEMGVERGLDEIARLAMAARQFGSRTLTLHSPGLAADGKFAAEALDAKAGFLDQAGKRCIETGVLLAYRTQDAEFQNEAAEITGLVGKTDVHKVYFDLDLGRASRVYPGAIDFFRDHPGRTFAIEAPFGDPEFHTHELSAAVKRTKWISWLIENSAQPSEASRSTVKKAFGV
jgi:sugar phosphate isomerase/epimerase